MNIVIVELPAKAKTINKYLGSSYEVLASFGHVRDLPAKNGSVDPDANFQMIWEIDPKANSRLNDIAKALKGADRLILATDPDREGEAISWHVLEVMKEKRALKDQKVERVVFNAITKQAVTDAMKSPRQIDGALVDAYMARRALDYLVGFTLSPVLWRKLPGARSAGRVQSVALRLVCDRELEIEKFVPREYWSLVATLTTPRGDAFEARLVGADGKKIQRLDIGSGAEAEDLKKAIEAALFKVSTVEARPARRNPQAPFTTSTLQQEASRKLGFAPAHTMRIAQRLYEGIDIGGETTGLITYMRTDGVQIDPSAITQARKVIGEDYGNAYVPDAPRQYQTKAKNAQEAHEAIRPTDLSRRPADMRRKLDNDQARLYDLIWTRTIASQMEFGRTRAHHRRYRGQGRLPHAGAARVRPGHQVRRFSRALPGRPRRRGRRGFAPPARHERRRSAEAAGSRRHPAFHRAAAALLGSLAGQAHGRARHRPALDLCLDPAGAEGPRLRQAREEAPAWRGQGPRRRRVPGKLLRALCRV